MLCYLVDLPPHRPSSVLWSHNSEPRRKHPELGYCPCIERTQRLFWSLRSCIQGKKQQKRNGVSSCVWQVICKWQVVFFALYLAVRANGTKGLAMQCNATQTETKKLFNRRRAIGAERVFSIQSRLKPSVRLTLGIVGLTVVCSKRWKHHEVKKCST